MALVSHLHSYFPSLYSSLSTATLVLEVDKVSQASSTTLFFPFQVFTDRPPPLVCSALCVFYASSNFVLREGGWFSGLRNSTSFACFATFLVLVFVDWIGFGWVGLEIAMFFCLPSYVHPSIVRALLFEIYPF